MESESYCLGCKKSTEIVVDNRSGDTICTDCGLVLEAWIIQETMEWRTFTDDSNNDRDPNRVGQAENPLLTCANLITHISNPKPSDASKGVLPLRRLHDPDAVFIRGFDMIAAMADRLGIVQTIQHRAGEIYKRVEDHKTCRGRKVDAVSAACLFIACRESKLSRTLKEFAMVSNGVREKEINRAVDIIRKQLEVRMGSVQIGEYVGRFCSYLGMHKKTVKAVHEVVRRAEELDVRRSPKSVLAAIIYMITQLSDDKKSLRDVSIAAEVAEGTIKKSYKDLYPHVSSLIPNWFANEEDIKKLCDP
ncbi:hypothetical protein ACOSP7_028120 [Xanthoceras sorbifolium]|uniref:TFIIB-type domain-containing protein n=1 Tax=Xanthoceras sorbifolium TaxID=99658 RepID=A0ABQ8HDC8_9ROSI|nr:hypothetical protein JRO89_XS12G0224200 [Xanthoceras sorbifolium]